MPSQGHKRLMQKSIIALTLCVSLSLLTITPAFALPLPVVVSNEIILNFPESATFRATLTSDAEITSVILEYGNEQQTCGEVIAKAFPEFTPGTSIIIATTGHELDFAVARKALGTPAGLIGLLGSRRKKEKLLAALAEEAMAPV